MDERSNLFGEVRVAGVDVGIQEETGFRLNLG